jgi:hypothetical protein
MDVGYARVSTRQQNVARQIDALKASGCSKTLAEIASGALVEQPLLPRLLDDVHPDGVIVIWKLDRLGRSLRHLIDVVGALLARDAGLRRLNDPVDTTTAQGKLAFALFASLAEFEREAIRERTLVSLSREGVDRNAGGRPKEARAFLGVHLPPKRTQELHGQLLAADVRYSAPTQYGPGHTDIFGECGPKTHNVIGANNLCYRAATTRDSHDPLPVSEEDLRDPIFPKGL